MGAGNPLVQESIGKWHFSVLAKKMREQHPKGKGCLLMM